MFWRHLIDFGTGWLQTTPAKRRVLDQVILRSNAITPGGEWNRDQILQDGGKWGSQGAGEDAGDGGDGLVGFLPYNCVFHFLIARPKLMLCPVHRPLILSIVAKLDCECRPVFHFIWRVDVFCELWSDHPLILAANVFCRNLWPTTIGSYPFWENILVEEVHPLPAFVIVDMAR